MKLNQSEFSNPHAELWNITHCNGCHVVSQNYYLIYQFASSKVSSIMTKHILIDYLICNWANPNEKACEQIDKFNGNGDPPLK